MTKMDKIQYIVSVSALSRAGMRPQEIYLLYRHAHTLHSWAVRLCNDTECDNETGHCWRVYPNGHRLRTPNRGKKPAEWITKTCAEHGLVARISYDPRGYVVRVWFINTTDGQEYGIA